MKLNHSDINEVNTNNVALVFVNCADDYSCEELTQLVQTAGGIVKLTVNQNRSAFDSATLIGSGKLKELAEQVEALDIDTVVFEEQLSPVQHRNIQDALNNAIVLDRTGLILDIFALHAKSNEGKLQVELAQLQYMLPRLRSIAGALSRQGAGAGSKGVGIGTRGPGETKLEMDRRKIRDRVTQLKERIVQLRKQRSVTRNSRTKNQVPQIALVGYTNAGKSTLFNALTGADVLSEDKLFATLDTTARRITLPNGADAVMFDTVGFINKLPHDLVDAFRSTLDEAVLADVILNICDSSSSEVNMHNKVTNDLLVELNADGVIIDVYNKIDLCKDTVQICTGKHCVAVSARDGTGLSDLLSLVMNALQECFCTARILLPYAQLNALGNINKYGRQVQTEYGQDYVTITANFARKDIGKLGIPNTMIDIV